MPSKQADPRSGRRYRKIRADFIARARATNAPCWLCGEPIDWGSHGRTPRAPELDHFHPASTHPHLVYEPSNFRISHATCNHKRGNKTPQRYTRTKSVGTQRDWIPTSW